MQASRSHAFPSDRYPFAEESKRFPNYHFSLNYDITSYVGNYPSIAPINIERLILYFYGSKILGLLFGLLSVLLVDRVFKLELGLFLWKIWDFVVGAAVLMS
jgi:hypothetical protein